MPMHFSQELGGTTNYPEKAIGKPWRVNKKTCASGFFLSLRGGKFMPVHFSGETGNGHYLNYYFFSLLLNYYFLKIISI